MPRRSISVLAGLVFLLAGCSADPREASKANFRTALQGWFDAHGECVNIGRMPVELRADAAQDKRAGYEALAAAGLLTAENSRVERPIVMGTDMSYDAVIYRPTDSGEQVIRKSGDTLLGGYDLCFARRNVVEVTSYTEPADVMGLRASQVRYRYRLENIAPWASAGALREALPRLARALDAREGEDKASLILTSEGWQHERSLRK